MSSRSKYKTKQRERLLHYFQSIPGIHITAGDLFNYFKEQDHPIGQSTIYRQLESLVDDGIINKYIIDGNSPACFEYTGTEEPEYSSVLFHCKCEKCGKLYHLQCDELEKINEHLYSVHQFHLDPTRTVFYGLCENCNI